MVVVSPSVVVSLFVVVSLVDELLLLDVFELLEALALSSVVSPVVLSELDEASVVLSVVVSPVVSPVSVVFLLEAELDSTLLDEASGFSGFLLESALLELDDVLVELDPDFALMLEISAL